MGYSSPPENRRTVEKRATRRVLYANRAGISVFPHSNCLSFSFPLPSVLCLCLAPIARVAVHAPPRLCLVGGRTHIGVESNHGAARRVHPDRRDIRRRYARLKHRLPHGLAQPLPPCFRILYAAESSENISKHHCRCGTPTRPPLFETSLVRALHLYARRVLPLRTRRGVWLKTLRHTFFWTGLDTCFRLDVNKLLLAEESAKVALGGFFSCPVRRS